MTVKSKSKLQDVVFYTIGIIIAIAFLVGLVAAIRWFGAATVQDRVVSPRQGVECLVVSAHDGVGVSCYQIPGAKP